MRFGIFTALNNVLAMPKKKKKTTTTKYAPFKIIRSYWWLNKPVDFACFQHIFFIVYLFTAQPSQWDHRTSKYAVHVQFQHI